MTVEHDGFLVKQHRPLVKWVVAVIVIALLGASFYIGRWDKDRVLEQTYDMMLELNASIEQLTERNDDLIKQNARLSADGKVNKDAYKSVNETLITLQQDILYLKEELVFYRSIVAPVKSEFAINLQEVSIVGNKNKDGYSYKIVLTKTGRSNYSIKGEVDISVQGLLDGKSKTFKLNELRDGDDAKLKYSFRYFQIFEGTMKFPEQFYPEKVKIKVKSKTKKVKSITSSLNWAEIMHGET